EKLESYDLKTSDLRLTFTAVNAADGLEGDSVPWSNSIEVKYKLFDGPAGKMCKLQAIPLGAIRYTTDGSSPLNSGHIYSAPFPVPTGCRVILAQAAQDGISSETLRIDVPQPAVGGGAAPEWRLDPAKPAVWRKPRKLDSTGEVFSFLDRAIRHAALLGSVRILAAKEQRWAELQLDKVTFLDGTLVRDQATQLRDIIGGANLSIELETIKLTTGQELLDLIGELKESLIQAEVEQ
ncbi:MAG TPA: chitobiase/beta-hexosaminidase C-terminal domain-containing protein, partial [Acidimicrobiales bacterium]|nr:chitobiase/beta-hexosaminidase C-terminal domain-containing protein [Acidimicrobiales bacterium]